MKQILQGDKDYICKKNLNEERPNAFPMKSGTNQECPFSIIISGIILFLTSETC